MTPSIGAADFGHSWRMALATVGKSLVAVTFCQKTSGWAARYRAGYVRRLARRRVFSTRLRPMTGFVSARLSFPLLAVRIPYAPVKPPRSRDSDGFAKATK